MSFETAISDDFETFKGEAWRNIFTEFPSKNLGEDVSIAEDRFEKLINLSNGVSGIDHQAKGSSRPFSYSDSDNLDITSEEILRPLKNVSKYPSRYSDGSFGVLYASLEKETSLLETLNWQEKSANELFNEDPSIPSRTIKRKLFIVDIKTDKAKNLVSLSEKDEEFKKKLTQDDHSFCISIGTTQKKNSCEVIISPSARAEKGKNCNVFSSKAIDGDGRNVCYVTFYFEPNKDPIVTYKEEMILKRGKDGKRSLIPSNIIPLTKAKKISRHK